MTWLAVMAGGALGALSRYWMAGAVTRAVGPGFPWGTLAVNVLGALIMGLIVELAARRWSLQPELRAFLTVGFLGGFTTFSAFSLETATMIERGDWLAAGAYTAASVVLCVAALFAGLALVRAVVAP